MRSFSTLYRLGFALAASAVSPLAAQYGDPIPDPITDAITAGDLVIDLETFVRVPASSGRGSGRARISIMRSLPDGRLFVNDLRGPLLLISENSTSEYLDLDDHFPRFADGPGLGTGFQSFAFHPEFASNGKFYTVHTEPARSAVADFRSPVGAPNNGPQGVLVEWTADNPAAGVFSGTVRELFRVDFPSNVHGLQEVVFNPNAEGGNADYGMLYVCVGEGGSYLDGWAENDHRLDSAMGTIFRIDPLDSNSNNGAYGIPVDNPWADATDPSILKEIYAYGFRNPHRLSWDRSGDNLALVGDIGEGNVEELNILVPGGDYGFPEREGTFLLRPDAVRNGQNNEVFPLPGDDDEFGYIYPVAQYDHDEGYAIIGGYVYRGARFPELQGTYIFGDISNGRVFYVDVNDLELGRQTPIKEARLSVGGVATTLQSLVDNSRADLRFGLDGQNELYLMTKTDGVVRALANVSFEPLNEEGDPEDWDLVDDFEEGLARLTVHQIGDGGAVQITSDPFADGENAVLEMRGSGSSVSHTLDAVADDTTASLYFRFAFAGTSVGGSVGPSDSETAFLQPHIQAEVHLSGSGKLQLRHGRNLQDHLGNLRPATWYEAWLLFHGSDDHYDFYLRGNEPTAPTLLASGVEARVPVVNVLRKFLWTLHSGSEPGTAIYFDDLHVDTTGSNMSSPVGRHWRLIADFESDAALENWSLLNANDENLSRHEETSGNGYLTVRAIEQSGTPTMAIAPLPRPVEIGERVTVYGRMRPEGFAVNEVWGLSNINPMQFPAVIYDAFEVTGRMTDDAPNHITIRDGDSYGIARGGDVESIQAGSWYEYWFVIDNGGEASGGQTFDVYWRADDSEDEPAQVYSTASFRIGRESPLTHFAIIANDGANGATAGVSFDDLFFTSGEVLSRPASAGVGLFPGPRGEKVIPWFGLIWDGHRPWIHHVTHRWVFVPQGKRRNLWMYDHQLGWMFTTPQYYPHIYLDREHEWTYYQRGSVDPRWFYGYERGEWFRVE